MTQRMTELFEKDIVDRVELFVKDQLPFTSHPAYKPMIDFLEDASDVRMIPLQSGGMVVEYGPICKEGEIIICTMSDANESRLFRWRLEGTTIALAAAEFLEVFAEVAPLNSKPVRAMDLAWNILVTQSAAPEAVTGAMAYLLNSSRIAEKVESLLATGVVPVAVALTSIEQRNLRFSFLPIFLPSIVEEK